MLEDRNFIAWFAKKIGVRPCRLLQLAKEKDRSWIPRNGFNESQKQEIYNVWLKKEYSIESVRKEGRKEGFKVRRKYIHDCSTQNLCETN